MPSKALIEALKKTPYELGGYIYHPLVLQTALEIAAAKRVPLVPTYVPTTKKHRPCRVPECNRPVKCAEGYCRGHYKRMKAGYEIGGRLRDREAAGEQNRSRRYADNKVALIEVMGGKCMVCEGVFPNAVYDFHHVGNKTQEPNRILRSANAAKIAKEICHCVLLCANCHRLEHAMQ